MPRTGLEFDDASVLLHEILGQAQAQPGAAGARGHQRMENALADVLGHARPVVQHRHDQRQPVLPVRQHDLARHPRAQHDARRGHVGARLLLHQLLRRVARHIQHRLHQPGRVAAQLGHRRVIVAHQFDRVANSAWISAQTRSQISWMFTGRAASGTRCGPLSLSTSACSRSASVMMTWVYSARAALGSSASSSWAAPRRPPRGS